MTPIQAYAAYLDNLHDVASGAPYWILAVWPAVSCVLLPLLLLALVALPRRSRAPRHRA
jgi:uncharacterized membrane protein YhdT